MQKMKRWFLLCVCVVLCLTACSSHTSMESETREIPQAEETVLEQDSEDADSSESEIAFDEQSSIIRKPEESSKEELSIEESPERVREEPEKKVSASSVGESEIEEEVSRSWLQPVQTDSPVDAYLTEVPTPEFTLKDAPVYADDASIDINNGTPFLEGDELEQIEIWLTPLDDLGRSGAVMMMAGPETLPKAERGSISSIHPSGWNQNMYEDMINDSNGALYRRCHMLMFAFSGLNATPENLITGTQILNNQGMGPYETRVLDYIEKTGHHVIYRCTPYYDGDELLSRGVLIEALSLEDDDISICVFCYNVQPGIEIDYATGENHRTVPLEEAKEESEAGSAEDESIDRSTQEASNEQDYIANTNTKKFHYPNCKSVAQMKDKNKWEVHCDREYLIGLGYVPCKNCNP